MSFQPPKGTPDILAPSSYEWRSALRVWDDTTERYGFPLVMTPVFEATDLFERGTGDDTEVVQKQMYKFTDKGGRNLTLRPEGTPGVMRAYLNQGGQGEFKGAYSGPYFRYERPQKGRLRQFWQVGVEHIGVAGPVADIQAIALGLDFLNAVGLTQLDLVINSLGDGKCRPVYVEALRNYLRERGDILCGDSSGLVETNPMRVLDCKACAPKLTDAPSSSDYLCEECSTHFAAVLSGLDLLKVKYRHDPRLVRGLDYYTRTTFEYLATDLEAAQNAVGGGGRYDGLAEALGGRPAAGIGFAIGLDRVLLARGEGLSAAASSLDLYLVGDDGSDSMSVLAVATVLRGDGVSVDFEPEGRSVKAQLRAATRSQAPVVGMVKGDQIEMRFDDQREAIDLDDAAQWLRARS